MKIKLKKEDDPGVNMSPMIDLVFLLLIFFLVASAIIDEKKPVEIPEAVYAKVPEDETGRFPITVDENGQIFLNQNPDPSSLEELKEVLAGELEFNEDVRIVIRADGAVRYKVNERIMEACADVGAVDLIFSAFEK